MSEAKVTKGQAGVTRRKDEFAKKVTTRIWDETPTQENPYVTESARCHGYDLLQLMGKRSYSDVMFLLFRGELPTRQESQLLEKFMIAFISPGPRHPAARAAMNAGVGKTEPSHILPIGLTILGGEHLGAGEVEPAIRWLRKNVKLNPESLAEELASGLPGEREGDVHLAPGFGSQFGSADSLVIQVADELLSLAGAGRIMEWGNRFSRALLHHNMGWLSTGLAAAVLADLGFQPRVAAGMFQIVNAPGIFAHGIEMASKPLTAMPFPEDSDYVIEGAENG